MSYGEREARVPAPWYGPESAKARPQGLWLKSATCAAMLASFATANECRANPPFINMLYPPTGITAPREDPAVPHVLPSYPAHAAVCKETGQVKLQLTIGTGGSVSDVQV